MFPVAIDQLPSTTRLLNAEVIVRMREAGGRAVERSLDIGIRPSGELIAIRPDFSGDEVPQGGTAKFSIIAVDPDGERQALAGAEWSLVKVERDYQWYRSGNSWNYEPVNSTKAVANGTIDIAAGTEISLSQPVDWGRYRLEDRRPPIPTARSPATSSMPAGTSLPARPRRRTRWKSPSTRPTTRRARSPS